MFNNLEPVFDRQNFWQDIQNALRRPPSDDPIADYIRQQGLRFVIQTENVESSGAVRDRMVDAWGPFPEFDIRLRVERLFVDVGEVPTPEHLALFHLAVIEGINVDDLEESPYDACYALMAQTGIQSVQPDLPYRKFIGEDVTSFSAQGGQLAIDKAWALRNMKVDLAWQLTPPGPGLPDGKGIRIAHLDTGWTSHTDLDFGNFDWSRSADFIDPNGRAEDPLSGVSPLLNPGHGTRTGSVMMSKGGITTGMQSPGTTAPGEITGVARDASYVPIRCIRSVMVVCAGDIAKAVRHATAKSCHVISMSLGGFPLRALRHAIQDAVANNLLVVAAAGNCVPLGPVVWPGRYPECITLAATKENDVPWKWSCHGNAVDLSAPGVDVWAAEPNAAPHGTKTTSGTSYATAHLAGVAALWLAFYGRKELVAGLGSGVNLQEVFRAQLRKTVRTPNGWNRNEYGEGIVDVHQLLSAPPNLTISPGRGHGKQSRLDLSFLGTHLKNQVWRILQGGDNLMFIAFQHELANLELDHGRMKPLDSANEALQWSDRNMSRTLSRWLID